ncbi:MAG: hypothetical protein FWE64_02030 [Alphaproteobacteria bacterium]|nr:hypothetical protein [Alphaproteobacteria bacterium]
MLRIKKQFSTPLKASMLCALCSMLLLASCAKKESQQVAGSVDHDFINAFDAFQMSRQPTARASNDTVAISDAVWLGNRSIVLEHRNPLPSEFETDTGITIVLNTPVSLQAIANNIHSVTGIPVRIDNQINSEKTRRNISVAYTGSLSGLLSQIATDLDLLWFYDRNAIVFFETETRTYSLYALGTDISFQSRIHTDDGNSVALESNMREWEEVERTIASMIGNSDSADFTVSRSLGTITVTAPPSVQSRVSEYIARQNQRLSQLIAIDVKVLQVSITNNTAFGLNLGAAINTASGLNLVANPRNNLVTNEATGMNVAVLAGLTSVGPGIGGGNVTAGPGADAINAGPLGPIAGSTALIQALAKQGKISLVTNVGVTTRNNRIAPISNTRTVGYIKRFESRNFTTVESSTVDQDNLETGFSMQLLPNVLENGRILLLFKMSIRELLSMRNETIGAVTLQLPEVEERSFMQEVIMESGQMLVLSGFERQQNNDARYGLGRADFMALGGSRETLATRDVLVVMLTPQVLVSPMDAERQIQQHWGAPLH